ncbi:MAG: hypothetical protein HY855_17170 [Burkholderiales bacterium]|nr:hypothetical protein [Burkholderiales bacterium]
MLHRNMNLPTTMPRGLDGLLGDLRRARQTGDMGRMALLSWCEVRRWARMAGEQSLAEHSSDMMTHSPCATREEFLLRIDALIAELEQAGSKHPVGRPMPR